MQPGPPPSSWQMALLLILLLARQAFGSLVNITIDDTFGDPRTGHLPFYLPQAAWTNSSGLCVGEACWGQAPPLCARNRTWHASASIPQEPETIASELVVQFEGSAIYVYGILDSSIGTFVSSTSLRFLVDGELSNWVFEANPTTAANEAEYECNALVYSNTELPHGVHNITIVNGGPPYPASLFIFDYAVYTFDNGMAGDNQTTSNRTNPTPPTRPTISSSTSVSPQASSGGSLSTNPSSAPSKHLSPGAIAGIVIAVVGSLLVIGGAIAFIHFQKRRERQEQPAEQPSSFLTLGRDTPLPLRALNNFGFSSHRSLTSSAENIQAGNEVKKKRSDLRPAVGRDSPQERTVFGATTSSSSSSHPFAQARVLPEAQ